MSAIKNISRPPFAQFSAEEEIDLEAIYLEQQNYHELIDLSKAGVSRFILGQRGQGKSATIRHLRSDLRKCNLLPIFINRYDNFSEKNNEPDFLYSIIQALVFSIAAHLYSNKKAIRKLNNTQRNEVGILIQAFYDQRYADNFLEESAAISRIRKGNWWKALWNKVGVLIANKTLSTATQITAQLIQSYTGTTPDFSITQGEYFEGISLDDIKTKSRSEIIQWPIDNLIKIVQNLVATAKALNYASVVVLFDQIDEWKTNTDVDKVSDFLADFLGDAQLLYTKDLSIVVSLWSEAKAKLNQKRIRFDKFKEIDIRWRKDELVRLINKRLLFYSDDKANPVTFDSLVQNEQYRDLILTLSAGSPRGLLTLFSYIQSEEISETPVSHFSVDAIVNGCLVYCKKYDYFSLQPSQISKSNDIKVWITRLLKMRLATFDIKQYSSAFNISNLKSCSKHLEQMQKMNLIRPIQTVEIDQKILYEITDPRILHLISRGITDLDS